VPANRQPGLAQPDKPETTRGRMRCERGTTPILVPVQKSMFMPYQRQAFFRDTLLIHRVADGLLTVFIKKFETNTPVCKQE
jgi:hypothetical protein